MLYEERYAREKDPKKRKKMKEKFYGEKIPTLEKEGDTKMIRFKKRGERPIHPSLGMDIPMSRRMKGGTGGHSIKSGSYRKPIKKKK